MRLDSGRLDSARAASSWIIGKRRPMQAAQDVVQLCVVTSCIDAELIERELALEKRSNECGHDDNRAVVAMQVSARGFSAHDEARP